MLRVRNSNLYIARVYGARRLGFRAVRLLGFDGPESKQHTDSENLTCPYARMIRKYVPAFGKLVEFPVPCGQCLFCKHHYQNGLIFRLYNHAKMHNNCIFVTLTYNDEHYTDNPEELRKDITKFIKRFRQELCDKTFSYYMVCEKGDLKNRCHFHMLMFWNGIATKQDVARLIDIKWRGPRRQLDNYDAFEVLSKLNDEQLLFEPFSQIGYTMVDFMDDRDTAVMAYVSKYVSDNQKKLVFRSWSLGLGLDILSLDMDLVQKMLHHRVIQYQPKDKLYTISVPSYYKNKLFSVSERDVMFYDYLCSEDYAKYKDLVSDPDKMYHIYEAYCQYEKRCLDRYNARLQLKKQKKRLL